MYVRRGCVHCGLVLIPVRFRIAVLALLFQKAKGKPYHQENDIKYCLWLFNFRFMKWEKTQTKTITRQTSTIDLLLLGSVLFLLLLLCKLRDSLAFLRWENLLRRNVSLASSGNAQYPGDSSCLTFCFSSDYWTFAQMR